jgi:hypothetical protein
MEQYVMVDGKMVLLENAVTNYIKKVYTGKADEEIKELQEKIDTATTVSQVHKVLNKIANSKTMATNAKKNSFGSNFNAAFHGAMVLGAVGAGASVGIKHAQTQSYKGQKALESHIKSLDGLKSKAESKLKELQKKEGK